jgi:hypothetical protein
MNVDHAERLEYRFLFSFLRLVNELNTFSISKNFNTYFILSTEYLEILPFFFVFFFFLLQTVRASFNLCVSTIKYVRFNTRTSI